MKRKSLLPVYVILLLAIFTLTTCGNNEKVIEIWIEGGEDPEIQQNKLADNVILIDELPLTLESSEGNVSRYSYSGYPPTINPGNILLSGTGEGYLHRVISVQDLGGILEVTFEQAALSDAFEELHLHETIVVDSVIYQLKAGNVLQQKLMKAGESVDVNIPGISFTDSSNYDVYLEGHFSLTPSVDIVIDISGREVKTFKAKLSGDGVLDLDTIFEAATAVDVSPPELTLIGHEGIISPAPMKLFIVNSTVPVGKKNIPVPVVCKFTLSAGVTFYAEDQATADFGFTSTYASSLGLEYQNGWKPIDNSDTLDYSFDPYMSIDRPVAMSVEAYIRPEVDTYLYGMLTPYFDHRLSGKGSAVIDSDPRLETELCIAGNVGAEIKIFSKKLKSVNFDIFDFCHIFCPFPQPDCNDGIDNDGDGYTDWPDDPGCFCLTDTSEYGTNECDDGVDNDGDGLIDWLADPGCCNITDASETSNGGFGAGVNYSVGKAPTDISVGDFNSDGIQDLAVTNSGSNEVSILLGNGQGDGTFAAAVNYSVGKAPSGIAVGDFNSDGIQDLATANYNSQNVSILLGNGGSSRGNGTFAEAVDYSVTYDARPGHGARDVAIGDFNSDGIQDLAVVSFTRSMYVLTDGYMSILLGNGSNGQGDGTFAAAVNYPELPPKPGYIVSFSPYAISVGDFNLDGIQDLAAANCWYGKVKVLRGNGSNGQGDGTFVYNYTYYPGSMPSGISVGDFNSDGIQDLAVADFEEIGILLGKGIIGLVWFEEVVRYPLNGEEARNVVIGDFNSDGIQDLATANEYSDNINTFLGNGSNGQGDGTFTGAESYPAGHYPQGISIGDFNSDGIQDLAVANYGSDNISILFGLCTF